MVWVKITLLKTIAAGGAGVHSAGQVQPVAAYLQACSLHSVIASCLSMFSVGRLFVYFDLVAGESALFCADRLASMSKLLMSKVVAVL